MELLAERVLLRGSQTALALELKKAPSPAAEDTIAVLWAECDGYLFALGASIEAKLA